MPKEILYGEMVTVRYGDIPVVAARTRDDLTQLGWSPPGTHPNVSRLDRERGYAERTRLLDSFVDDVQGTARPGAHHTDDTALAVIRRRVDRLRDDLNALPAHPIPTPIPTPLPASPPDPTPDDTLTAQHDTLLRVTGAPTPPDPTAADADVAVQTTLTIRWDRDLGQVGLYVAGHDHNTGLPVDGGGWWVNMGWSQVNRTIRKLRVARDQSCGAPE